MPSKSLYSSTEFVHLVGLICAYCALAIPLLKFGIVNGNVTIFWPAGGVGLAALVLWGNKFWPGILIGSFISGLAVGNAAWISFFIAIGNTLESVFGCWLLSRAPGFNSLMTEGSDFFKLGFVAVIGSCLSAIIGSSGLYVSGDVALSVLPHVMLHWWQGDTLGIVLVTSFILTWQHRPVGWTNRAVIFFLVSILVGQIIFLDLLHAYFGNYAWGYWMYLIVGLAAIHFGRHGALLIAVICAIQALTGASLGVGYFGTDFTNTHLLNFWTYMLVLTFIGFYLSATIEEQKRMHGSLRISNNRYQGILQKMMDAYFRLDTEGRILETNLAMSRSTGYSIEELLKMNISEIEVIESPEETQRHIKKILKKGHDLFESKHRCKDGKIIDVEISSHLSSDNDTNVYAFHRDITQRKRDQSMLALESSRLRTILETASDGIHVMDQMGNIVQFSHAFSSMLGYPLDEIKRLNVLDWDCSLSREEIFNNFKKLGEDPISFETKHCRKDGSVIDVEITARSIVLEGQKYIYASSRDITDRKQAEQQLKIAATVFESQEGMMVTDANGDILKVNQSFTVITGYSAEEVIGRNPRLLSSGRHDSDFYAVMWEAIKANGVWKGEIWNRRKNGEIYPEHLAITAVKEAGGHITNYVATLTDITMSKSSADAIENLAFYDQLTHLPNRRLLFDRIQQAFASSARSGKSGALLFLDLDNFKTLNDTLGHQTGDILLQQIAERLTACVREGDTVARLGGDEFVVLLEGLSERMLEAASQAEMVGMSFCYSLNQPYKLGSRLHHNTSSIGVTLFNAHDHSVEELLQQADIAMYQAKKSGRNALRFYDPQMQASINAKVALEHDLRQAIDKKQFELYYQIQVDTTGLASGAEALLRWIHPELDLISPSQFIPLAEETGLILPIGNWVLETACAQLEAWQGNVLTRDLILSVNVSAWQFRQENFAAQVQAIVQAYAIEPGRLKLELTESMLVDDIEMTIATMGALNELGVQLSLDDFGTGYSSLQYLKRLPLDQLKIDQSFIQDIVTEAHDQSIVRTIIAMAQSLELDVIAEGVETEEQRQQLVSMGCAKFQGYLFGKPVPLTEFLALLKK